MEPVFPFSSNEFFVFSFVLIIGLHCLKKIISKLLTFNLLIFLISVLYVVVFIPKFLPVGFLVLYLYGLYFYFGTRANGIPLLLFTVILSIPLVIFKLEVHSVFHVTGISYISFRAIQATIDMKNHGKLRFTEFISFLILPTTILAGPIDRSYRFQQNLIDGYKNLNLKKLFEGYEIFIVGALLKFVLARVVNTYWLQDNESEPLRELNHFSKFYAYSFYLYFDFAGYSAMAVGLSKMLGIDIPMNFNKPFLAQNPQELWRRFHITLGSWLTDYFFKPIYKWELNKAFYKKHKLLAQNIALIFTFVLMGFWNGFKLHYILSGTLFGLYSAVHNSYVFYIRKTKRDVFNYLPNYLSRFLKRFINLHFAAFALYVFSGRLF